MCSGKYRGWDFQTSTPSSIKCGQLAIATSQDHLEELTTSLKLHFQMIHFKMYCLSCTGKQDSQQVSELCEALAGFKPNFPKWSNGLCLNKLIIKIATRCRANTMQFNIPKPHAGLVPVAPVDPGETPGS